MFVCSSPLRYTDLNLVQTPYFCWPFFQLVEYDGDSPALNWVKSHTSIWHTMLAFELFRAFALSNEFKLPPVRFCHLDCSLVHFSLRFAKKTRWNLLERLPNYVAAHYGFVNSSPGECDNCRSQAELTVEGFVHLSSAVIPKYGPVLKLEVIKPYLKENLKWRVQKVCCRSIFRMCRESHVFLWNRPTGLPRISSLSV
jgi:hypothetical protein